MNYLSPDRQAGFTLLELIIALSLFALVSVMSYNGLLTVMAAHDQGRQAEEELGMLQTAMVILQRDIEHGLERPVRDQLGDALPPFYSHSSAVNLLEFTRGGWGIPGLQLQSDVLRVGYRLSDGQLLRQNWPVLDRAHDTAVEEYAILENVQQLKFRFLGQDDQWHDYWPLSGTETQPLPRAVEIQLQLENWGDVRRLFRVNG